MCSEIVDDERWLKGGTDQIDDAYKIVVDRLL